MINTKIPDLTTTGQKTVAGVIVIFILMLLWFLLPPLVVILKNLVLTLVLGAVVLGIVINYELIWNIAKQVSWDLTKKHISSNKFWYLDRGFDHMNAELDDFKKGTKEVGAAAIRLERQMSEYITEKDKLSFNHETADELGKAEIERKVAIVDRQLENTLPKVELLNKQHDLMSQIIVFRESDLRVIKFELDARKQDYVATKEASNAFDTANKFLANNEGKEFKEALSQLEKDITTYMANINMVTESIKPKLQQFAADKKYDEAKGKEIIEAFKQSRLTIN